MYHHTTQNERTKINGIRWVAKINHANVLNTSDENFTLSNLKLQYVSKEEELQTFQVANLGTQTEQSKAE